MGQRSDEIKRHIDEQRSELTENLEQLEQRVRSTTDWRAQFDKRPLTILGLAFGGGLLLGTLIPTTGRGRHNESSTRSSNSNYGTQTATAAMSATGATEEHRRKPSATSRELRKTWSMVDDIRATLIGVGASKLRDYLNRLVPGFNEHYQKREEERRSFGDWRGEREYATQGASQTGSYSPEI